MSEAKIEEKNGKVYLTKAGGADLVDVGYAMNQLIFTLNGIPTLVRKDRTLFRYTGTHYEEVDETQMRDQIFDFLDTVYKVKIKVDEDGEETKTYVRVKKSLRASREVFGALFAKARNVFLDQNNCFLSGSRKRMVPFANGLLNVKTKELEPHTPEFFCEYVTPYSYDPSATCKQWETYVRERWPGDQEAYDALQQIFGYIMFGSGEMHKIFYIWGEQRSGKGTITKMISEMLGGTQVASAVTNDLVSAFGKQKAINKKMLVFPDVRLGNEDHAKLAEALLSISGGDVISVSRKYKEDRIGILNCKLLMFSNEVLQIRETSGALSGRMIMLRTVGSFYGSEVANYFDRFRGEVAGVLNWALEGWEALQEANFRMVQPKSGLGSKAMFEDSSTLLTSFVEEVCVQDSKHEITDSDLYEAYVGWCRGSGQKALSRNAFRMRLQAAYPEVKLVRRQLKSGTRQYYIVGLQNAKNLVH